MDNWQLLHGGETGFESYRLIVREVESMKKLFFVILGMIMLFGCNHSEVTKEHQEYLESFGWTIKKKESEEVKVLDYYPEYLQTLKIAELDLEQYQGKEATITTYLLKEKQINGDKMKVFIYEIDGEIIGGHGLLENWSPGAFSLDDKERLKDEGIMKK